MKIEYKPDGTVWKTYEAPAEWNPVAEAHLAVEWLTDAQRLELFARYCQGCGAPRPRCPCPRDE